MMCLGVAVRADESVDGARDVVAGDAGSLFPWGQRRHENTAGVDRRVLFALVGFNHLRKWLGGN